MAIIIYGKAAAAAAHAEVAVQCAEFVKNTGVTPALAVVLVGEDPGSVVYVRNKKADCEAVGITPLMHYLPAETTQAELDALIDRLNADTGVHGILVQHPLPPQLDEGSIYSRISPHKDVDAFNPVNVGRVMIGDYSFLPGTPAGIMELLRRYNIDLCGKRCVVVGRSNIVGKPMAMLMLHANATVTICHSRTAELAQRCREADVLVAAIGKPKFFGADMVKPGAVVIDVGMDRDPLTGKLCGDVDFAAVEPLASYITPVPGGVGPMTRAILLRNTLTAAKAQTQK